MPDWFGFFILFLVTFFANGILPMPVTAVILWMGQSEYPLIVVLVATVGNMLGWIAFEKYLLAPFLQRKPHWVEKIPEVYRQLFLKNPGGSIFMFNALPFPWDPTRFLAVAYHYDSWKLWLWMTVSRVLRFGLLVFLGAALFSYQPAFWGVLLFFLLLPLIAKRFLPVPQLDIPLNPAQEEWVDDTAP